MENNNQNNASGQQTINIQVPSADNIASRRPLIPTSFALVIILFFFTFFEFQCQGRKAASITGINLVTGKVLKDQDPMTGREREAGKIPPNFWAILALGAAAFGLGAFLKKDSREAIIGTGAGVVGFISLIILQFDIKSKTSKDFERQVEAVFQFPYWLAVISLGVAAIISYLRIKKSYQIVPSASPPSIAITPPSENVSQVQPSVSSIPQTSSFDTGKWMNKNKKIIITVFVLAAALFAAYYFFIKLDPIKDAKKAATAFCECGKEHEEFTKESYKKLISEIDSIKFSGRADAQKGLEALNQNNNVAFQECYNAAQEKLTKLKERYIGDKGKTEKFEYAYNAQMGLCNNNSSELGSLYNQALEKINQYIGPVEKEQARQDSIRIAQISIRIGSQVWMKENLNVSTYRNGDAIPQVQDPIEWINLTTGAWCYYDNDPGNGEKYGKLYNWYAVNDPRGLAPKGWHIPTEAEWTTLSSFLGGELVAGGKMKVTTLWISPNTGATNESGFAGLPGGIRNNNGPFSAIGSDGYWWSSTEDVAQNAVIHSLSYPSSALAKFPSAKGYGNSVRCVRD